MTGAHLRSDRGAALITAILVAALFLLIGSIASQQAVVSFLISHRITESAQALVAAETALAAALADMFRDPSFSRLARADGGPFPFLDGAAEPRPLPASFAVETLVHSRSDSQIDIIATAQGRNRARRVVLTTIERGGDPFLPAALYLGSDAPAISSTGALEISGSTADGVAALACRSREQMATVESALAASGARIDGDAIASDWSHLEALVARVRATAQLLPDTLHGPIPSGVWISAVSADVANASGKGIWLIDGDLRVGGALAFDGLLIVLGDIRVGVGAEIRVRGAVAQADPGRFLDCDGRIAVDYDVSALDAIESAYPGMLDQRARVIGWRDEAP